MNTQSAKIWRAGPTFFFIACTLYFIGSNYFDALTLVRLSVVSVTLGLLIALGTGDNRRLSILAKPFAAMALLALINILVSTDWMETALRWAIWFEMLVAMGMLATQSDDSLDHSLASLIPLCMALVWFSKYLHAGNQETFSEAASVLHLSAFFASLTLSTGALHPNKAARLILCTLGIYGILFSGSRAAILFLPLQFTFGLLYHFRNRVAAVASIVISIVILVAVLVIDPIRDATFGKKAEIVNRDAFQDATTSLDDRGYLRDLALEYMSEKPLGYGYGNTYTIQGVAKDRGTNFHNGILNVGVAMGIHVLLVYICFLAWLAWSLLEENYSSRLYRHLFLAILMSCGLRSLTEDFTLFDLGNPVAYLVIYMSFVYVCRRNIGFVRRVS